MFDGGFDDVEVGGEIKVAGRKEAVVPNVSVFLLNSRLVRIARNIRDDFGKDRVAYRMKGLSDERRTNSPRGVTTPN